MAQAKETVFHLSSPHSSSGGADSCKHEGTPDTRLTAFSPDESSVKSSKLLNALNLSASKPLPVQFTVEPYHPVPVQQDKDPFVTTTPSKKPEQKLSATASTFRPLSAALVVRGSGEATPRPQEAHPAKGDHIIGSVLSELSTDLHIYRCLVVSSTSNTVTVADIEIYLSAFEQLGSLFHGTKQVHGKGDRTYIRFSDIRDAGIVHSNIQVGRKDWVVQYVSPNDFNQTVLPGSRFASSHEGQLAVVAVPEQGSNIDFPSLEAFIYSLLEAEGQVFAFQKQTSSDDSAFLAIVEFCDATLALNVAVKFKQVSVQGAYLAVTLHKPDEPAVSSSDGNGGVLSPPRGPVHDLTMDFRNISFSQSSQLSSTLMHAGHQTPPLSMQFQHPTALIPMVYGGQYTAVPLFISQQTPPRSHSATSSSTSVPLAGQMYPQLASTPHIRSAHHEFSSPRPSHSYRPDGRRQNATRINRGPSNYYNQAGHHNHVDVNRIREGIDVRTTIMLRNIPNKVDQGMLKRIVDESSWGKYDFMYLRIDFANDCNVGYAFINFVDPLDIIDFVNARGNQRWNCFKSDKVAEISYATIQGKDCLVQKFRNSSVMLETPHYRPKLYYTSNGPMPELAGQEEPFPEPDNQSKMKRSCENAEHVGLFTPNAGQHFRDEQRRRRSQFDRGTRLAALEEYDYEAGFQNFYPSQ